MDDRYYQMTKECVSDTEGLYNVSRVKCEVEMLCDELPLSEVSSLLSDLHFFASCDSEAMDSVSLSAACGRALDLLRLLSRLYEAQQDMERWERDNLGRA